MEKNFVKPHLGLRLVIASIVLGGALIFLPARADAGMHFCNKTSITVNVAMATLDWLSYARVWGWWQVEPSACKTPIGDALDTTGDIWYYYYAYDAAGGTWTDSSRYAFCIDTKYAFDYDDAQDTHCSSGERRHFRRIDTGSSSDYTVSLTE